MRPTRLLILSVLAPITGCGWLIGADDGRECEVDLHCLTGQICDVAAGRCLTADETGQEGGQGGQGGLDLDASLDARPPDMEADVGPDLGRDFGPDLGPDVDGDLTPTAPADPPFPLGECFDGAGALATDLATTTPRGWCVEGGALWLGASDDSDEAAEGAVTLRYFTEAEGELQRGPTVDPEAIIAADGEVVLYEDWAGPQPVVRRFDLAAPPEGTPPPLEESLRGQIQPARRAGISGFIELGPEGEQRVILLDEGGRRVDCGAEAGVVQWGLAIGTKRVGWFERRQGSQQADLVLSSGLGCDPRVAFPLGPLPDDAALYVDADRWYWLIAAEGTGQVWTLDYTDRAPGPSPVDLARFGVTQPVELAVGSGRLAVVDYRPGGHRLTLIDLDAGTRRPVGAPLNVRRPTISARFLLWAGQGASDWEVMYAPLD